MQVLLAENAEFMQQAFIEAVHEQGHETAPARQFWLNDAGAIAYRAASEPSPELSEIDVALVDECNKHGLDGPTVVRGLTLLGIPCVAIAAMPQANQSLLMAGAKLALPKPHALAAIFAGALPLDKVDRLSGDDQNKLAEFIAGYRKDESLVEQLNHLIGR